MYRKEFVLINLELFIFILLGNLLGNDDELYFLVRCIVYFVDNV